MHFIFTVYILLTSAQEFSAFIYEVRSQFVLSHELLETQEVQTTCPKTRQKVNKNYFQLVRNYNITSDK